MGCINNVNMILKLQNGATLWLGNRVASMDINFIKKRICYWIHFLVIDETTCKHLWVNHSEIKLIGNQTKTKFIL